ncbi:DUF928 domain-containing protein [Okeania sp.]|uniref:DUF928 domain-containing protein n=1 Tax=Okeania sp. TaxID=3100323 RepID=UPI002B4AADBA|nr:DUF928 domain-containing protein [Okeania sp.]MEB3339238.1 DUF928 domain-containing protein [Okeania sp.]
MFLQCFFGLSFLSFLVLSPPVNLQQPTLKTQVKLNEKLLAVEFPTPPSRKRAPARKRAGGSRGPCSPIITEKLGIGLTAVMPENNIGTTVSSHPTVYLYVPKTNKQNAEFVLYDLTNENIDPIYETNISLPQSAGIIKVNLPKTVELQPDNTYVWYFGITCDPDKPSLDYYIQGWLQRTSLTSEVKVKLQKLEENPLEKAKLYAELSVWSETITTLEKSRSAYPQAWKKLFQSIGLGEIADSQIFDFSEEIQSSQR